MTEAEWLWCRDPDRMLRCLCGAGDAPPGGWLAWLGLRAKPAYGPGFGRATDRKLRLFACACCRRVGELFRDERSRAAVEAAELYADGRIGEEEARAAAAAAWQALDELLTAPTSGTDRTGLVPHRSPGRVRPALSAARAATEVTLGAPEAAVAHVVRAATEMATEWGEAKRAAAAVGAAAREELLRDLFGNPFRSPLVNPAWLAWDGAVVRKLAEAIYEEQAFDRLPVLADALEEAGCTDAEVLTHCRGGGEHARGCWVLDTLLGRE